MNFALKSSNNLWLVLVFSILFTGCTSNATKKVAEEDGLVFETETPDKFEKFNRKVFALNLKLDRWLMKPVAQGYRWVSPTPVEIGVSNFFSNIGEVGNVANGLLQGKWKRAGNDSGRFLLNTTLGILGLFDVAKYAGLKKSDSEDFGQTLAAWGVPQGPYLMLPFFGPMTARSGIALPVDTYLNPLAQVTPPTSQYALAGLDFVRLRAALLDVEDLATGDMYLFVRDAYLQRREYLLNDGKLEDDFGDDFGSDDFGDDDFDF